MSSDKIELILDTREEDVAISLESNYLKKECGHVDFYVEALDVGDFLFKINADPICIIERKTHPDHAASIKDKRSKNQVLRIKKFRHENPGLIVIYLIEGDFMQKAIL